MKHLHMKQTVASQQTTATKDWSSHHQTLGIAPSAVEIPKLSPSTQNETEPAPQVSPLNFAAEPYKLCFTGCLITFIDPLRSPQIF